MSIVHPARAVARPPTALDLTDPRWAEFVASHSQATAFHLPGWATAVADCYGFRAFALATISPTGAITGGLPVVEVRRPLLLGRAAKWVALPFTDYCPPLDAGENRSWPSMIRSSLAANGVSQLQLRAMVSGGTPSPAGVRHVLALAGDPDQVYRGFHKSQVQRNIRRAERDGVTVRVGDRATDLTEIFYQLHLITRRRQGVPVQPRRLFELIWREVIARGDGTVLIAERAGQPLAAAVFLRHNHTVIYKYGASDSAAWSLRPNHALFWQAIRTACVAGDTGFDWGRTDLDNAGLRAFKAAWGAVETPLIYTTIGAAGAPALPEHDLHATRAAQVLAATIRHSPPWVCTAVGRALYRFTA